MQYTMQYTSKIEIHQRAYDGMWTVWRYMLKSDNASSWMCIAVKGDRREAENLLPRNHTAIDRYEG